ncbi:hypothetical protein [uncultured Roseovarius sp.]|uniref:hypothetical protein n=1 Tax=Roseovarius sp. TaxID=1486281 RepID=UPI0025CCC833|nr:hypothetical protein [uncultured Roseovarius sp.]
MTTTKTELMHLQQKIAKAGGETRYRYEPQVRRVIERLNAEGQTVPEAAKRLHHELLSEAIEAQFDNMPV